jgi:hypothetical protein
VSDTELNTTDALALAACRRANADRLAAAQRLYAVIEAGGLLKGVKRSPGVRTSSSSLTRYQSVLEAAGITRQTAFLWQRASDVPALIVQEYVAIAEAGQREITIAGLLKFAADHDSPLDIENDSTIAPPTEFPKVDEDVSIDYACPRCGHEWSGNPKPGRAA